MLTVDAKLKVLPFISNVATLRAAVNPNASRESSRVRPAGRLLFPKTREGVAKESIPAMDMRSSIASLFAITVTKEGSLEVALIAL